MLCSAEYPEPLLVVVSNVRADERTPGETDGELVLPLLRAYVVRLNVTGKENFAPSLKLPVGRLEF